MVLPVVAALGASALGSAIQMNREGKRKAPDVLAQESIIQQITPEGTLRTGSFDKAGNFIPSVRTAAVKVEETPFQAAFRTKKEQDLLDLIGQVSPLALTPRSAQDIRGIVPSAQATREGLPEVGSSADIRQTLSPFVGTEDFGSEIARLEESTFEGVKRRLEPQFEERQRRLEQQLSDIGIPRGSEAYDRELRKLRESEDEALTRAAFESVGAGRAEQERLARLGLSTRGQQVAEGTALTGLDAALRSQLFGENRAQLQDSLTKQIQLSELERAQQAQALQLLGANVAFQPTSPIFAGAQPQQQQQSSGFGGFGQLAGAALGSLGSFGSSGLPAAGASGIPAGGFAGATGIPFAG